MENAVRKGNSEAEQGKDRWLKIYALMAVLAVAGMPEMAMAGTPWDNMLNGVIGFLNAGTIRLIAILFIIGLGFLAWAGKLTMGKAAGFVGGIVLVFGAAAVADLFIATV